MSNLLLSINPIAFEIGSISVRWYGIIITAAILIGYGYSIYEAKRHNISFDFMLELFLWVVPLAIVFARIAYVVFHIGEFFPCSTWDDFVYIFAVWEGGISILGAIPGGALGVYIATKRYKISFCETLDVAAPGLILGQALGRWGNFINQELYGEAITNIAHQWFPLAVYIDGEAGWFQATFFYEMVLNLVGFAILVLISRNNNKNLTVFISYLAWYMIVRAIMESIRADAVSVGSVKIGVLGCSIAAVGAVIIFIMIKLNKIHTGEPNIINKNNAEKVQK